MARNSVNVHQNAEVLLASSFFSQITLPVQKFPISLYQPSDHNRDTGHHTIQCRYEEIMNKCCLFHYYIKSSPPHQNYRQENHINLVIKSNKIQYFFFSFSE